MKHFLLAFCLLAISSGTSFSQHSVLYSFSGSGTTDGMWPYASSLVTDGTFLYGTTYYGGSEGKGVVFKVGLDGSGFTLLHDFTGTANGYNLLSGLTLIGNKLYGTTYNGGTNAGVLFRLNKNGTAFEKLHDFAGSPDGRRPVTTLNLSGSYLYGTTSEGGTNGTGTIFKIDTNGTGYSVIYSFSSGSLGANPGETVIVSGTILYGTTTAGGSTVKSNGVIYKFDTQTSTYTVLQDVGLLAGDLSNPHSFLTLSGTTLYGTIASSVPGSGVVFKINTDGSGYSNLVSFTGSNGANPYGSLVLSGNNLYGFTYAGGNSGVGAIFCLTTEGNYTRLSSFNGTNGYQPYFGYLLLYGSALYGTTIYGGANSNGAIFKYVLTPETQASNLVYSNSTSSQFTASWTSGSGTARSVFVKAASTGTASPVNNTTYSANTTFSLGTEIGSTGWYCVYNGYGTSVTVTGLSSNTEYRVMVCEYSGSAGSEQYQTAAATNNPGNQRSYIAWTGGTSTDWALPANWSSNSLPGSADNLFIPAGTPNLPLVNSTPSSPALCNNLVIGSGARLTIDPGKALTINGTLSLNDSIILKSSSCGTASLIPASTDGSTSLVRVERYIPAGDWSNGLDAWHFLSSPVSSQAISPAFTSSGSGNDYDFYCWHEPSNLWVNFKNNSNPPTWNTANGSTNFSTGKGYLVAYQQTSTRSFTGSLNNSIVTVSGLTTTTGNTNGGWNLLGNPYPSSLTWSTGWTLTNIGGVSKIWNESGQSYTDISEGGVIPNGNGFMVYVTASTGSVTIPLSARLHSDAAWYKALSHPQITLTVYDPAIGNYQESKVILDPASTEGFDLPADCKYLAGYAPGFYSVCEGHLLSTNSIPLVETGTSIPFTFIKNKGSHYQIKAEIYGNWPLPAYMSDSRTGTDVQLENQSIYEFTSDDADDPARFLLRFGNVGISEGPGAEQTVYSHDNILYIKDQGIALLQIYSVPGSLVYSQNLHGGERYSVSLENLVPGLYFVTLSGESRQRSCKIIVF